MKTPKGVSKMKTGKQITHMTLLAIALSIICGPLFAQEAEAKGDMVPLKLKLPKQMFVGTPKNIKSDNLERPRKGERPTFMLPKGSETNIAAGKPVSGSDIHIAIDNCR